MTTPGKQVVKPAAKAPAKKMPTKAPVNAAPNKLPAKAAASTPPVKAVSKTVAVKRVAKKASKPVTGSFNNKFAPRQKPIKSVVTYRHIIAAEFWLGLILILTQGQDDADSKKSNRLSPVIQAAAFITTMAILFGITAGGRNAARISATLGGVIILTLGLKQTGVSGRFGAITSSASETIVTKGS